MQTIKDLVTGRTGLAQIFRGQVVCGSFLLGWWERRHKQSVFIFILTLIHRFILLTRVLSGVTFIIRRGRIAIWRVVAFARVLPEGIVGLVMAAVVMPALL